MQTLLKEAFEKAAHLPESVQDVLAKELLAEIEGERQWDKSLADSQDVLDKMTKKAMEEYESGKTEEMGFDEL